MSKELMRPQQYRKVQTPWAEDESVQFNQDQQKELSSLYESQTDKLSQGKIVTGKVIRADNDGVLVDIGFKSYGLIPPYEFNKIDLQKIIPGSDIEVLLEDLENVDGNVSLSYEQAKALRAWILL